jgi:hypothetical protein
VTFGRGGSGWWQPVVEIKGSESGMQEGGGIVFFYQDGQLWTHLPPLFYMLEQLFLKTCSRTLFFVLPHTSLFVEKNSIPEHF